MLAEIPADRVAEGDVVETMEGRYGRVIGHGWDSAGAFGYFLQVERGFDRVWIYHGVVRSREGSVWKK